MELPGSRRARVVRHRVGGAIAALRAGARREDVSRGAAARALAQSRTEQGAFYYYGRNTGDRSPPNADRPAGSAGRSAICETMPFLLGDGSPERIAGALKLFYRHWNQLEKRRQKSGTHKGSFLIAPYYFYYGHRYPAQAVSFLPEDERARERQRLEKVILLTRDEDGTWNDRIFPRSRAYGTAMVVLALLGEEAPAPPPL